MFSWFTELCFYESANYVFLEQAKLCFLKVKLCFFIKKKWKYVLSFFSYFLIDVLRKWCQRSHASVCKKWCSRYQTLVGICTLLQHMHTSKIYLSLKDITRIDVFSVCGPMGGKWGWICTDLALPLLTEAWWAPKQDSAVHIVQITQSSVKHPN